MERPKHSLITCETHPFVHCQETKRSEVKRIEAVTTLLKQINYKLLRLYIKKKLTKPEKKRKGEQTKTLTIIVRDQEQIGGLKTM